jgi:hypothetical protein
VWQTRNDGATWEQIPASRFPGLATGDVYVSRIEPSHFDTLTYYVTFDNHRWNDFTPYVYVTTDAGKSFRSIAGGLPNTSPADFVHVVREDPYNRDLLYVGTSRAAYTSLDRGATWQRLMAGMPTVPVYDLKIHPRDRELIAATHGRGLWIVDVAPLEQMAGEMQTKVMADAAHLFTPKTAYEYGQGPAMGASSNGEGHKVFNAPSPAYGAEIVYKVNTAPAADATPATTGAAGDAPATGGANAGGAAGTNGRGGRAPAAQARILITDAKGDTVRTLTGPASVGLHRVMWDFRGRPAPRASLSPSALRDSVAQARRTSFVLDSLEKAGTVQKPVADMLRRMLLSGDVSAFGRGGGGGGRGGAGGSGFVARPGEGAIIGASAARGGQGGEGAAAGAEQNPLDALQAFPGGTDALQELMRVPGSRTSAGRGFGGLFGGGGGRGGQAPVVNTGDYLVTLTVGGKTYKQVLRVERLNGGDESGFSFGTDDDDHEP